MLGDARGALVALQARDFQRAVTFYTTVLGLEMTFRHGDQWAEFRAPGLTLGVGPADEATVVGGGTTTICFEVPDIEKTVQGLRSRGVSFLGSFRETDHGREISFIDSEGSPLMLHQASGIGVEGIAARRTGRAGGAGSKRSSRTRAARARGPSKGRAARAKGSSKAAAAKRRKGKR